MSGARSCCETPIPADAVDAGLKIRGIVGSTSLPSASLALPEVNGGGRRCHIPPVPEMHEGGRRSASPTRAPIIVETDVP